MMRVPGLGRLRTFARIQRAFQPAARAFRRGDVGALAAALDELARDGVDATFLRKADTYLPLFRAGRRLVASFDPARRPADDEVVVIFGNYPRDVRNLVSNNPIKRNLLDYWSFAFDASESHPCWRAVDRIYVINLDSRLDRYYSVLRELARMRAPFERIERISAIKDRGGFEPPMSGYVGCFRSHIAAVERALADGHENVLILEDDFAFTDELEENTARIGQFFERGYDYRVCLLGTSKYGRTEPLDDLVSASFQECTNAEGYFVSRSGLARLSELFAEGLSLLVETRDERYAIDRYWSRIQDGRSFLVFRDRLGLQLPSFSNIEGDVTAHLD